MNKHKHDTLSISIVYVEKKKVWRHLHHNNNNTLYVIVMKTMTTMMVALWWSTHTHTHTHTHTRCPSGWCSGWVSRCIVGSFGSKQSIARHLQERWLLRAPQQLFLQRSVPGLRWSALFWSATGLFWICPSWRSLSWSDTYKIHQRVSCGRGWVCVYLDRLLIFAHQGFDHLKFGLLYLRSLCLDENRVPDASDGLWRSVFKAVMCGFSTLSHGKIQFKD